MEPTTIRTGKARAVLVVDDAPTVRLYHGSILRQAGFEITEAGNGFEALELAMTTSYDLMFVDVNMPQLDGHALVKRLRSVEVGISCPVVMISTEAREIDAETAYRVGANLFLTKPVAPELLRRLAEILTAELPAEWLSSSIEAPVGPTSTIPSPTVAGDLS
jgi:two-component system chemotaxis response regulator CheY